MIGYQEWGAIEYGQIDGIVEQIGEYTIDTSRVIFNGFSLANDTWKLKKLPNLGDSADVDITVYDNPRNNGQTITGFYYRNRTISVRGSVITASEEALREEIQSFKKKCYKTEGNLDIIWGDKTYRFVATCQRTTFNKLDTYPMYRSDFDIVFECRQPFGQEIGYTVPASPDTITEATRSDIELVNDGSAGTPLVMYIKWNDADTVSSIDIGSNTTSEGLTITATPTTGDIWLIDGNTKTITKVNDGTTITDWTGTFIELYPEVNSLDISVTSTSHSIDVTFKWKEQIL